MQAMPQCQIWQSLIWHRGICTCIQGAVLPSNTDLQWTFIYSHYLIVVDSHMHVKMPLRPIRHRIRHVDWQRCSYMHTGPLLPTSNVRSKLVVEPCMPVTTPLSAAIALASYSALSNLTSLFKKPILSHMHTKPQNHTIPPFKTTFNVGIWRPRIFTFQFPRRAERY